MLDSARYTLKTGKSSNKRVTIASKLMWCQGAWQAAVWWVRRTSFFICRWTSQTASSSTFYARKRSIGPKENDWDERVRQCVKATLCLTEYDKVLCVWSVQVARGAVDHTTNAVHEDLSLLVWCFYFYIAPDIFSLILYPDINGLVITLALSVMVMFAQFQLSPSCLLLNSCELPGPGRWCSWAPCLWLANPENQSQSWQDHSKSAGAAGVVNRQTVPTLPLMSSLWKLFCLFFVVIFIFAHKTHTKQRFFFFNYFCVCSSFQRGIKVFYITIFSPQCQQYRESTSVLENQPAGTFVLQVHAVDADEGSNGRVTYGFMHKDSTIPAFSIHPDTGT